ncbi:MAG TPA: hypothetical protein VLB44_03635 [Kofleriaceae bacterium]|nr:hypothetical protein [Kofleriaceae bacterium]
MIASRAFMRTAPLVAVALLVVNDHVLKARYPGLVTGKLSDLAGLVFFPLLLAAIAEQIGVRRGIATVKAAVVATGVAFAAFKLSAPAGEVYRVGLAALQWPVRAVIAHLHGLALPALGRAHLTQDPTDLVALVALVVPLWLARSERLVREPEQDVVRRGVGMDHDRAVSIR